MQNSLLTTKLYFPPVRPMLVHRPRLVERLQAGLQGPLTLLSAPAGSGKTTLLSEWRAGAGARVPAAWLSLSAEDNDLARFLHYLVTALDDLEGGLTKEIQPLLQTSETPNAEAILTLLINSLNDLEHESVLALDDYHLIELPAIHNTLTFLLDHLPPRLHLVLLTRADPILPLARLRARGQMTEIRAEHLRFSVEECAQFLNQVMGLDLTGGQVAALEKRTEGWIAGLQLAALSMQGRADVDGFISAFTGSNHYIVDYLAEEVLNRQPEAVRAFLLKTSILERLTGPLCDALTGGEDGSEVLAGLDHANLFVVPLDNEQRWYRYHHLFADLLQGRLLHARPKTVAGLHIKASGWFEENGFLDEAIDHALEAKDFERAARLFCRDSLQVIYNRPLSTLDRWLRAFPDSFLRADPWLCIARAHVLYSGGQRNEFIPYILCAQETLTQKIEANQASGSAPDTILLQGEIFAFQALEEINRSDFASAVKLAQKAIRLIPKAARNHVFALGSLYMAYQMAGDIDQAAKTCSVTMAAARSLNYVSMHATASFTLARLLRVQGKLRQASQSLRESLEYVKQRGQQHIFYNGILHIGLAEVLYEWNSLDEMERELETGLALSRQGGMNILVLLGLLDQALLKHARGDLAGAFEVLNGIENDCKGMDPRIYQDNCALYRLRWQAMQGNTAGLEGWLQKIDLNVEPKIGIDRFVIIAISSEFLSALGRYDEALHILEKMGKIIQDGPNKGWSIFTMTMKAAIHKRMHNESRALDCLKQALVLAEPEGYVRVFLNLGEPMRDLLHALQKRDSDSPLVKHILASFEPRAAVKATPPKPKILSEREVELLGLVAAGRSNKEIASELVISVGTVKRHTVNIFNKLDVKNRTEAVARARELGLL